MAPPGSAPNTLPRHRLGHGLLALGLATALSACTSTPVVQLDAGDGLRFTASQVDDCDDYGRRELKLDAERPLTLLVHGCKASSARFRSLEQLLEASGRQTLCFNYDHRHSIASSARRLSSALKALEAHFDAGQLTIIAHSQGGLVARRALEERDDAAPATASGPPYRLITIASPFNGIEASAQCGRPVLHLLSLGIVTAVCQAATGSNWPEIHPRAPGVVDPAALSTIVTEHLQIVTDERDSCRRSAPDGSCSEDDYVFSIAEQINSLILSDERVDEVTIRAGHAAIVGDEGSPPYQLVELLQEHGIMPATTPRQAALLRELMARLY